MTETSIRTFFAAIVCAFTILGISSCALFPFSKSKANTTESAAVTQPNAAQSNAAAEAKANNAVEAQANSSQSETVPAKNMEKPVVSIPETAAENKKEESIEGSYNQVWLALIKTLGNMGLIVNSSMTKGHVQANVRSAKVTVDLTKSSGSSVALKISALKAGQSDPDLASSIVSRIRETLKSP